MLNLTCQIIKPILHALLIPSSLTFLSVASNRRLKASAFKLVGAYVSKVCFAFPHAYVVCTLIFDRPKACSFWICPRMH